MSEQDLMNSPVHIPIDSDKETSIPPTTQLQHEAQPQPAHKPANLSSSKKHGRGISRYQKVRSLMLIKAESLVKDLNENQFAPPLRNEFSNIRQRNRTEIYKYLLFGYQQIVKQWDIKRILKQPENNEKLIEFIHNAQSFEQFQQILKQKTIQIENKMLEYYNNAGSLSKQSKKYKLQIGHLLSNLGDVENRQFRQDIIIGVYEPDDVACMSFIDMLDARKKQYLFTKNEHLLNYQQINSTKNKRQQAYEQQLIRKNKLKRKQEMTRNPHKNIENQSIQYLLSDKLIEKLEIELMEIPMKTIRKATLNNLRQIFE